MPAKKYFLSSVDLSREIRRPSLVGMQFFYKGAVSASDLFSGCAGLNSKDLIGLLVCHFSVSANVPSVFLSIIISRVLTPVRLSPVQVSREQRAAVFIYFPQEPDRHFYVQLIERGALMPPFRTRPRMAPVSCSSSISKKAVRTRDTRSVLFCVRPPKPAGQSET